MSSAPSRSSADPLDDALTTAVGAVSSRVTAVGAPNPVVLIDGRSGAGKSSLARRLVSAWPGRSRVQLVALDDVYPGWGGLAEGAEYARESILLPHAKGTIGVWQRWDWETGERAEAHAVDPSLPLVVEGAGILTPAAAALADVRVWVDAPDGPRKDRALNRDGETYRPHWDRWAAQEAAHLADHAPQALASVVVFLP
ncbi:MAG: hypothetical protein BGO45_09940 [Microbacterium sp. 71-36]|uniref:hypothetical protein n=1 Tax=unclassified Microbacterium TaxID=2609290 RepID=UPI0008687DBA|nr:MULTISPECIES: hypothetical protein [unclassified Microbacterium]MBN9211909.1 hypothetical protein [Microbacterium sp.]ODT38399.1 MAG: hypothetical protein ABS60_10530 [Microbacterium sp. SCN 71-17]OJV77120.1 MAG: hypothetical protein BGO45_09940 [Microbacterium sp. 71-36]